MYESVFPFAAIVGQETLKQSLLIGAVNPKVGGVLIRGEKGTAKSTAVRALASLLPKIKVPGGCPFSCDIGRPDSLCPSCRTIYPFLSAKNRRVRVVNLPLNATEDRVVGGIDFSRTVKEGAPVFSPGLLADAHRGILYVDEVNLLDDHIVDIILDSASSGQNRLEREGISFFHEASFILVGTMNPEEGELRPQLLDRFGLCVEVTGAEDPDDRVLLMGLKEDFDLDPKGFMKRFDSPGRELAQKIADARALLPLVRVPRSLRGLITEICSENNVAGHRADLVMEQAARALCALSGNTEVAVEHIKTVAPLVLIHRQREAGPPPPPPPPPDDPTPEDHSSPEESKEKDQPGEGDENNSPENGKGSAPQTPRGDKGESRPEKGGEESRAGDDKVFQIGATFKVKPISSAKDRVFRRGSGRRSRTRVSQKQGRYVKSRMFPKNGDIALDATLRAAAPFQKERRNGNGLSIILTSGDIRGKVREKRIGNFLLFVVDASGSMGARGRMAASKGAIMSLLLDAYQKRDRVGMISFRRKEATLNLPPTSSVELAGKLLGEMPVGGRTPLSAGLAKTYEQVRNVLLKDASARPIVILITDGKSNVSLSKEKPVDESMRLATALARDERSRYVVVDTEEEGLVTFGLAGKLASAMGADYFKINDLKAKTLVDIVKGDNR